MNDNLVFTILKSYINLKIYKNRCIHMLSHIEKAIIEPSYKQSKIKKIYKLLNDVNYIRYIPLKIHNIALLWIELRWKNLVIECGYLTIDKTLQFIVDYNFEIPKYLNSNDNKSSLLDYNEYINNIKNLIIPIHVQISKKESKENLIKLYSIKPSLTSTYGKLYGLCIEYINLDKSYLIFGIIDKDNLRLYRNNLNYKCIYDGLNEKYDLHKNELDGFINCFSLRDYLVYEPIQIINKIKQQSEKLKHYQNSSFDTLYTEYMFLPYEYRVEMISLMLEFDLLESVKYILLKSPINLSYLDIILRCKIDFVCSENSAINISMSNSGNNTGSNSSYNIDEEINNLNTSDKNKSKALDKLKIVEMSNDGAPKAQKYIDGFLKIPFGNIRIEDDLIEKNSTKNIKYIKKVDEILNLSVHGHDLVKIEIKRLIAQWITGGQSGLILGIEGPPGVGKTSIIKKGLSKCLIDINNNPRPVGFIPLGGSSNASSLVGHGYTYQGSTWGRIVDILMDCGIMNPIFMFDELDKVSRTESGREIISILTHLTDTTQNKEFYDKYFDGVELDLSKALMIFTFNNREDIDPILLDRMKIIETKALTIEDKLIITEKHLLPQIYSSINIGKIYISSKTIKNIIYTYTREAGVRQLKKILESLCQELNLKKLINPKIKLQITNRLINSVMHHKDKVRNVIKSNEKYLHGEINGMYANSLGLGGILPIQVSAHNGDEMILTGMQGDVMKESMKCAKTMAYSLYNEYINNKGEIKNEINKEKNDINKYKGIHIHVPTASTPKDGPSAGGAICIALYSHLTGIPIKTDVSMTGEMDLRGNIGAIGGLYAKLHGAKKAKIKTAIIPYDNLEQLERIRKDKRSPEDKNFNIILVKNIKDVLDIVLFNK